MSEPRQLGLDGIVASAKAAAEKMERQPGKAKVAAILHTFPENYQAKDVVELAQAMEAVPGLSEFSSDLLEAAIDMPGYQEYMASMQQAGVSARRKN